MFSPLIPILPAEGQANVDARSLLARIDAAQVALAATARLAGRAPDSLHPDLALRAELPALISLVPSPKARDIVRELDCIGIALHAGLSALESARRLGRLNRAAAALLHAECAEALERVLALALAGAGAGAGAGASQRV